MKKIEPIPLTKEFLISRGKCCGSKCLHCPYNPTWLKDNVDIKK